GAGPLDRTRRIRDQLYGGVPVAGMLQLLDFVKIDAIEHEARGMESAKRFLDRFVDLTVVQSRRLPAHSSDESDRLHALSCRCASDALAGLQPLRDEHPSLRSKRGHAVLAANATA